MTGSCGSCLQSLQYTYQSYLFGTFLHCSRYVRDGCVTRATQLTVAKETTK